jgi:hypothetical protein
MMDVLWMSIMMDVDMCDLDDVCLPWLAEEVQLCNGLL